MKEITTEPGTAGGSVPVSRGRGVLKKVTGAAKWVGKGFIPPIGAVKRAFGPGVTREVVKKSK